MMTCQRKKGGWVGGTLRTPRTCVEPTPETHTHVHMYTHIHTHVQYIYTHAHMHTCRYVHC